VILNGKIKLMNMKENIISKIKLMISYDMGKTLIENKEINNLLEDEDEDINEINPAAADDALATLKNLGKGGKTSKAIAQDIVATMSKGGKEGEAIHIIGKNNNLVPVTTGDELLVALKAGTIDAVNLGRVNKGILKSGAVTDVNLLRNIASDVVVEANFINKYGKEYVKSGEAGARKLLQDNGYTRNAIDEIIAKMNKIPNYGKDVTALEKGLVKAKGEVKTLKGQKKDLEAIIAKNPQTVESATGELKAVVNNNITVGNISQGAAAGTHAEAQAIKEIASEAKVVAQESKAIVETMKPSKWEKFKKVASRLKMKYLIILGIAGVGGWYLWKFFKGGTTKPENELFGKCLDDVIDDDGTTIANTTGGDPVVVVKNSGNSEYDGKGGLLFFNNGRVFMGDKSKRGGWSCKGKETVIAEQGDGNPNTGIGGINIKWDGETAPVTPDPVTPNPVNPNNVNYHDCSTKDFPFEFGCIAPKIAEIQKCLGITPQKGNFGPKTKKGLEDLQYNLSGGITKETYDKIIAACKPTTGSTTGSTTTVTGSTTGSTATVTGTTATTPITPPAIPAEPVFDKNRLQELIASKNLVKKRKGVIVKWIGPELDGNDYYILNKHLVDKGYIQKKQRETGDRDDEDVTMKYKWKLQGEE
jgi:hypothetical protein